LPPFAEADGNDDDGDDAPVESGAAAAAAAGAAPRTDGTGPPPQLQATLAVLLLLLGSDVRLLVASRLPLSQSQQPLELAVVSASTDACSAPTIGLGEADREETKEEDEEEAQGRFR
jgi:hypothetical protein